MKNIFLTLVFLFTAQRLLAIAPEPYTEAITFSSKLTLVGSGGGGGTLTIYGEGTAFTGAAANGPESTLATVWLRPGKQYSATYAGALNGAGPTNGAYWLNFTAPTGYGLFVNGSPADMWQGTISGPTTYVPFSYSYTLELRPLADNTPSAAGSFSGIDIGKSVTWDVGLGGLRTGKSAGRIYFKERDLTNSPASRGRLYFSAPANNGQITVVKDGASNQNLRQVAAPQTVVDLLDDAAGGYWFKFYAPSQSTWNGTAYTFSGTPWRTIRVEAISATKIKITETEGAAIRVSSLELTSGSVPSGTYNWTLQEGDASTWLRTTTHASTNNGGSPATRDDVVIVRTGSTTGTIVAKTRYRYTAQSWGEELTQTTVDPDGAQLNTTYVYHTNAALYGNYRRVKSVTDSTGNWTSYAYYDDWNRRGRLSVMSQPFQNSPAAAPDAALSVGNSVSYDYFADNSGRYSNESSRLYKTTNIQSGQKLTTATLNLTRNSKSYTSYQVNDYSSASGVQTSTVETIDSNGSDSDFTSQPYSVKRPDQSQDSLAYHRGTYSGTTFASSPTGTYFRTIAFHGSTNASGANPFSSYDGTTVTSINLLPNQSTMEVTVQNPAGLVVRKETHVYIGSGAFSLVASQDFTYDFAGRLTQSVASNGATISNTYTNGLLTSATDATGSETRFVYDQLLRVSSQMKVGAVAVGNYPSQSDVYTYFTYDGANHVTESIITNSSAKPVITNPGALDLFTTATFDLAGRPTLQITNAGASSPANRLSTSYTYNAAARIVAVTLPGGGTKTTEAYLDGQLKNVSGSSVVAESHTYFVDSTGKKARQSIYGGVSSAVNTYTDWLNRVVEEWSIGGDGTTVGRLNYFNNKGQLWKQTQSGSAPIIYTFDTLGGLVQQGIDTNTDDQLTAGSTDRISERGQIFFTSGGKWYKRETSSAYATNSDPAVKQVGKVETQLSGFPIGRVSFVYSVDIYNNITTSYTEFDRANKKVTTTTALPESTIYAVQIAYNGLTVSTTDTAGVTMRYEFDALGRQSKVVDPRTAGTTSPYKGTVTAYCAGTSMVSTITDPANVVQVTYDYDSAGRVKSVKDALNKYAYFSYNDRNQKLREWGQTTYPVEYVFDSLGRQTQMKTYATSSAGFTTDTWPASPDNANTTTWNYHATTGLLSSKTDAANKSVSYTYKPSGQVYQRTSARNIVSTFAYFPTTGELSGITYSDTTSPVSYTYNRLGQLATVVDATGGTRTFNYNLASTLELQSEDLPAGYYASRRLTNTYATSGVVGRATGMQLGLSAGTAHNEDQTVSYGYQADGRLSTVAGNAATYSNYSFTYDYVANSHLVRSVVQNTVAFATYRDYHAARDQLVYHVSSVAGTNVAGFQDWPDDMGRNAYATRWGKIFDRYDTVLNPPPPPEHVTPGLVTVNSYNDRSELTNDITYIGWGLAAAAGRNNSYDFDKLGNRISATHNGNTANYTLKTNGLNQYDSRVVPGVVDVAGAAVSTTVTITPTSSGAVLRNGQSFFDSYLLANSSPASAILTINAPQDTPPGYTQPAFLAASPEPFTYDDDGNLTRDGRWVYQFDAENRLIVMFTRGAPDDPLASSPANAAVWNSNVPRQKLMFTYDYLGRRVAKVLAHYDGSAWVIDDNLRFVYSGWNMIAMLNANSSNALVASYFWGLDLSGTTQGAGGIGGLLMVQGTFKNALTDVTAANTLLPVFDCMGNVHAMIKSDGSVAAAYEYDSFGNTIRESGPYAASNPFRYSTKYADVETGLVYYGQRYYSPSLGRFINRDPIAESGGVNLYGFCGNNGVNNSDYLGMSMLTLDPNSIVQDIYGPSYTWGGNANYKAPAFYVMGAASLSGNTLKYNLPGGLYSLGLSFGTDPAIVRMLGYDPATYYVYRGFAVPATIWNLSANLDRILIDQFYKDLAANKKLKPLTFNPTGPTIPTGGTGGNVNTTPSNPTSTNTWVPPDNPPLYVGDGPTDSSNPVITTLPPGTPTNPINFVGGTGHGILMSGLNVINIGTQVYPNSFESYAINRGQNLAVDGVYTYFGYDVDNVDFRFASNLTQSTLDLGFATAIGFKDRPNRIFIGENMDRLSRYARQEGGYTLNDWIPYKKWSLQKNLEWIRQMRAEGWQIIDLGPDFQRRQIRLPRGLRLDGDPYNYERIEIKGYPGYQKIFDRTNKMRGGVRDFDPKG